MKYYGLVGLTNGVHLFERELGSSCVGEIERAEITNEVAESLASYLRQTGQTRVTLADGAELILLKEDD